MAQLSIHVANFKNWNQSIYAGHSLNVKSFAVGFAILVWEQGENV